MGHITAMVLDAAEIWAYECLLPDDWPAARVSARLAELIKLPAVGFDNYPIDYGLIRMRGHAIDPQDTLADANLPDRPIFRIVPEIVAGQDTLNFSFDEQPATDERQKTDVKIISEKLITEEVRLDLKPDVRIDAAVHKQIEEFAYKDRHNECAGLLLGKVIPEEHDRAIHIKAAVPAYEAESTRTSVKIGLDAWEQMLLVRDKEYDDLDLLGWFHTHAGWGVFMSDSDVFIHRHFFKHPDMVSYVLDPTKGKDGFFYWHNCSISLCPNYGLVGAPSEIAEYKQKPRHTLRKIIIALLALAALCAGAARLPFTKQIIQKFNPPPTPIKTRPHKAKSRPAEIKTQVYAMHKGESLWRVCKKIYGDARLAESLAEYNGIKGLRSIQIGQEIRIPPKEELEAR
jgi:proteasome lid subunit RPN8/RPN11